MLRDTNVPGSPLNCLLQCKSSIHGCHRGIRRYLVSNRCLQHDAWNALHITKQVRLDALHSGTQGSMLS